MESSFPLLRVATPGLATLTEGANLCARGATPGYRPPDVARCGYGADGLEPRDGRGL